MTLSSRGKCAGFQTYVLGILGPWKCLEFGKHVEPETGQVSFPYINLGSSVSISRFHVWILLKRYFPLIKKKGAGGWKRESLLFFFLKDLMMFTVPSKSRILQFRTQTCQNRIIKEDPFLPSSYQFSYKTRHCASGISVVNNLSTFPRWEPPPHQSTHPNPDRHPVYL